VRRIEFGKMQEPWGRDNVPSTDGLPAGPTVADVRAVR